MTPRHVRIDHRAAEEFDAAADWYEARRAGLGRDFIDAVDAALQTVQEAPRAGVPVPGVSPDSAIRRVFVRKFPYAIVYVEKTDGLVVLAIAHGHRRPGYWRDRIPR